MGGWGCWGGLNTIEPSHVRDPREPTHVPETANAGRYAFGVSQRSSRTNGGSKMRYSIPSSLPTSKTRSIGSCRKRKGGILELEQPHIRPLSYRSSHKWSSGKSWTGCEVVILNDQTELSVTVCAFPTCHWEISCRRGRRLDIEELEAVTREENVFLASSSPWSVSSINRL